MARFQIVGGGAPLACVQAAGKVSIPAVVRQISNEQAMEIAIIENLQREDLNPMEQAARSSGSAGSSGSPRSRLHADRQGSGQHLQFHSLC